MDQVAVTRSGKVITVTIPKTSKYLLEQFSFAKFVSEIEKFEVVEDGSDTITMQISCFGESVLLILLWMEHLRSISWESM